MSKDPKKRKPENQPGAFMGIGIVIGAGVGVVLGLVFDNLALGIAIGAGIGLIIGIVIDQRNR